MTRRNEPCRAEAVDTSPQQVPSGGSCRNLRPTRPRFHQALLGPSRFICSRATAVHMTGPVAPPSSGPSLASVESWPPVPAGALR